jgi:DNA mismatch repair protein MutS2
VIPTSGATCRRRLLRFATGAMCLPVKLEYRQQLNGVLHDQSASGSTLFVEPMPVVQLQNQLTALANQADREIERILSELSAEVAALAAGPALRSLLYTELDLIVARGRLSLAQKGGRTELLAPESRALTLLEGPPPAAGGGSGAFNG